MTPFAGNSAYQGKRILVVESDVLVPFALYRMIERFGAEIVGPVGFADDLTLLARDLQFDGAIIDSRIPADGRRSIEALMRRSQMGRRALAPVRPDPPGSGRGSGPRRHRCRRRPHRFHDHFRPRPHAIPGLQDRPPLTLLAGNPPWRTRISCAKEVSP